MCRFESVATMLIALYIAGDANILLIATFKRFSPEGAALRSHYVCRIRRTDKTALGYRSRSSRIIRHKL
jgi:hypothetical protein